MEEKNKAEEAVITVGISIPLDSVEKKQTKLKEGSHIFSDKKQHSQYSTSDINFSKLPLSLDPNLGLIGYLPDSNIEPEKSTFNPWNIEPHFLCILPLSTSELNESSILLFGGINFSSIKKDPLNFDNDDFVLGSTIFQYFIDSGVWKYYGTMFEPRCYHACALNGQYAYVTGGYSLLRQEHGEMKALSSTDRLNLYDQQWKSCADMLSSRAAHALVSHKGYLYAFGGRNSFGDLLASVEIYYPDQDMWIEITSLPQPTMGLSATTVIDSIWVIGGITDDSISTDPHKCLLSSVFSFIPSTNRWCSEEPLPYACAFSSCVSNNNVLWVVGGCTISKNSEECTMVSCSEVLQISVRVKPSKWKRISSLMHPRHALTTVLYEECVYVFGGIESVNKCSSDKVEIIDSNGNVGTLNTDIPVPITGCASVLLQKANYYNSKRKESDNFASQKYKSSSNDIEEEFNQSNTGKDFYKENYEHLQSTLGIRGSQEEFENMYLDKPRIANSIEEEFNQNNSTSNTQKEFYKENNGHLQSSFKDSHEEFGNIYSNRPKITNEIEKGFDLSTATSNNQEDFCIENEHFQSKFNDSHTNFEDTISDWPKSTDNFVTHESTQKAVMKHDIFSDKIKDLTHQKNIDMRMGDLSEKEVEQIDKETKNANVDNLRYRTSVEIVLNSDKIKSNVLKKNKSSALKWLNHLQKLSASDEKLFEKLIVTKDPKLNVKSEVRDSKSPKNLKSIEVKYFEKDKNSMPEASEKCFEQFPSQSFMYIQSNIKSECLDEYSKLSNFENQKKNRSLKETSEKLDYGILPLPSSEKFKITINENFPIILLMGGENSKDTTKSKIIISYSCSTNSWEYAGYMPEYCCHHCAIFFDNRIYIIGGFHSKDSKSYDKITNRTLFYDICEETWQYASNMNYSRAHHSAIILKNKIYVFGGRNQSGEILSSVEMYDVTSNKWRLSKPLPYAVLGAATFSLRDSIYLLGGITYDKKNEIISSRMTVFDQIQNSWSVGSNMPIPLAFCGVASFSNNAWLFGGLKEEKGDLVSSKDILKFDVLAENWNKVAELSIPRLASLTVTVGNKAFIIGGHSIQDKKEVLTCEEIDLSTNEITIIKPLPVAISGRAGVVLLKEK